tara:strand:- start:526 stop:723 length:198 start_codon:yes stop_codon:yes gene_type:complete
VQPVDLEIITRNKRKVRRSAITQFHMANTDLTNSEGNGKFLKKSKSFKAAEEVEMNNAEKTSDKV